VGVEKKSAAVGTKGKHAAAKSAVKGRPAREDAIVTIDRRRRQAPVEVERRAPERRAKVNRRRQIDPTTCERDYSNDEVEFMNAMDEYKRRSGRMFPTCSEVLEVIRSLGYVKQPAVEQSVPAAPLLPLELSTMPVSIG